jgi:hypothetical protein
MRDGIAFPQILVTAEGVLVSEVPARIPGGKMADHVRHALRRSRPRPPRHSPRHRRASAE